MEGRQRILVIDGDGASRRRLSSRLQTEGFEVIASGSVQEGFEALAAGPVDLVFLDMAPEPPGIQIYLALRADPRTREIPVILRTAQALNDHWELLPSDKDGPCFVMGTSDDESLLVARITQLLAQAIVEV